MTADFRLIGWRLLGLGLVVAIYLVMPWIAPRVGHEFRLVLIVPICAALAGAMVLVFYRGPEALPAPVLRTAPPPIALAAAPSLFSLIVTLVLIYGALAKWTQDTALSQPARLTILLFVTAPVCFVWYRARRRTRLDPGKL